MAPEGTWVSKGYMVPIKNHHNHPEGAVSTNKPIKPSVYIVYSAVVG